MNKARRLIGVGYFPKELPLEFNTVSLANNYQAVDAALAAWQNAHAPGSVYPLPTARSEVFSLARGRHSRRQLRIPNPIHYTRLAVELDRHWSRLRTVLDKSKSISLSRPIFKLPQTQRRNRATNLRPIANIHERRLEAIADAKVVLQADVAHFFPSIYTHSIAWAIHGKRAAKRNRGPGLFGNTIDRLVQYSQDGQTAGIPVGPDSSHIISELIASRIDDAALSRRRYSGFRYVDDYFLAFKSERDAITALDAIAGAAREFELQLNYAKTSIARVDELDAILSPDELLGFDFGETEPLAKKELHKLFSVAFEVQKQNDNALKYAIQAIAQRKVTGEDWPLLEAYLMRSASVSPNCFDVVAYTLFRNAQLQQPLNLQRIVSFFSSALTDALTFNRDSEACWILWAFKALDLTVPAACTRVLGKTSSSIVALLTLDLQQRGQLQGNLDTSAWLSLLNSDELLGENWLLVYESQIKNWLAAPQPFLANDPLFGPMQQANISFYDTNALATLTHQLRGRPASDAKKLALGAIQYFLLGIDPQTVASNELVGDFMDEEPDPDTLGEEPQVVPYWFY